MSNLKLEFFYYDACPFCQRVKSIISDLNIKLDYCDISTDNASLERLMTDTGRRTVPCLYINNKPMFESADIANWLKDNVEKLEKN